MLSKSDLGDRARSLGQHYHYAWLIVGMATVLQVTTNFISQAFAILLVTLSEEPFMWTLTGITLAYFFRSVTAAVLSPLAGWVGDRYGARRAMLFGATLFLGGMLLLSSLSSKSEIWQLYLYYSLILGIAQSLFSVNIPTTVAAWFRTRLGTAVGIQQSTGGMGASIMAPVLAFLMVATDWKTAFWIIAAAGGAIVFSLLAMFHSDPADRGMEPYGTSEDDSSSPGATSDRTVARLRSQVFMQHVRHTNAFWNLIAIHHLGCIGHSIIMVGVVFYARTRGVDLADAAWIISIYSFSSIGSRLATPILADRWGAKGVMALAYTIQGITVALLFWTQDPWQFYFFAFLFGIGFGGEMSAFIVINRQYYGMGPLRTAYGWQMLGSGLGMAIGGLIGSVIFDYFGSYNLAWAISIGASLGGATCIFFLESTSRILIPNWEASLPKEARSTAAD